MPSAEKLASGLGEVKFEFKGDEYNLTYRLAEVTQKFKAQSLLLSRQAKRIEQRQERLLIEINDVSAEDGSPEAAEQDRKAELAIQQLIEDDVIIKRSIGKLVATVVDGWDVTNSDGSPYLINEESLMPMRADFLSMVIQAITQDATVGEANASSSQTTSPSQSRQGELLVIGHLSPNSTDTSLPVNGVLP